MKYDVIFAPEAQSDLLKLYEDIAKYSNLDRAYSYTEQIRTYCLTLDTFPERGHRRDDVRPGLRIIGFKRRVTIAFHVTADTVVIDGIFYGGQNWEGQLQEDDDD